MKEGGKLLKYWNDRIFKYWNIVLEQDSFNNLGFAAKEDVSTMEIFYLWSTAFTLIIVFLCIYRDSNSADDDVDNGADDDVE